MLHRPKKEREKKFVKTYISAAFACNDRTSVPSRRALIPEYIGENRIVIGAETVEILIFCLTTIKYMGNNIFGRAARRTKRSSMSIADDAER